MKLLALVAIIAIPLALVLYGVVTTQWAVTREMKISGNVTSIYLMQHGRWIEFTPKEGHHESR